MRKVASFLLIMVFFVTSCLSSAKGYSIQPGTQDKKTEQTMGMEGTEAADPTVTQVTKPTDVLEEIPTTSNATPKPTDLLENKSTPSNLTPTPVPADADKSSGAPEEETLQVSGTVYPQKWMNVPVVPEVSERAQDIYQRGLEMGNDPQAFSKIGDCQNITDYWRTGFLSIFEDPEKYSFGEDFEHLQSAVDHFQGSFGRKSLAVAGGLNISAVQAPLRADPSKCASTESPLACEIRRHNPSIVIISFEEWWHNKPAEEYAGHLRTIIEYAISQGTVPIIATKADNLEGDHAINRVIVEVAQEYDVPLWNFWRAAHALPGHGVKEDGFHLTYGGGCNQFENPVCLKYAWPIRNLTALQAIYTVWQGVSVQNIE